MLFYLQKVGTNNSLIQKLKVVIDITESLEKNIGLESNFPEEDLEKSLEKKTEDKKEEKKKTSFLSMLGRSMLYHPWGFPY